MGNGMGKAVDNVDQGLLPAVITKGFFLWHPSDAEHASRIYSRARRTGPRAYGHKRLLT